MCDEAEHPKRFLECRETIFARTCGEVGLRVKVRICSCGVGHRLG